MPLFAIASTYTGKIEAVVCHTFSPICQIRVLGPVDGNTCSPGAHWQYAFDSSTSEGKNILSLLVSAQMANKKVALGGLNSCAVTSTGESEDLRHVYIVNN